MKRNIKPSARLSATFFALIVAGCLTPILLMGCQRPEEKVENAKEKVATANQDLKEARRDAGTEWQEDWLKLKRDNDQEIAGNERRIIEIRKDVNTVDAPYRAKYNTRIDEFERRNNELRDRVNNYKNVGDEKWVEFKKDIKRDMDDLKSSLKNFTIKNN